MDKGESEEQARVLPAWRCVCSTAVDSSKREAAAGRIAAAAHAHTVLLYARILDADESCTVQYIVDPLDDAKSYHISIVPSAFRWLFPFYLPRGGPIRPPTRD
jgi:hypothetical protein